MAVSIYKINKGVNKSIEFKGLKAQYIWYLGGGVIALMILFAGMYLIGINQWICITIISVLGVFLVMKIYAMSSKYGEYGMMKMLARKSLPVSIRCRGGQDFIQTVKKRN